MRPFIFYRWFCPLLLCAGLQQHAFAQRDTIRTMAPLSVEDTIEITRHFFGKYRFHGVRLTTYGNFKDVVRRVESPKVQRQLRTYAGMQIVSSLACGMGLSTSYFGILGVGLLSASQQAQAAGGGGVIVFGIGMQLFAGSQLKRTVKSYNAYVKKVAILAPGT